ncbi:unnamed protein product [Heterobilharzia americana]|nr:unnamed protein product [Heterobilharzia americana]
MSSSDLTHRYQINSNVAEMSEDSSSGYSQITPTLSSSNARLSYPSYLTGIDEDTKGELVHSVFDLQHEQKQYNQSGSICAVPLNVCCVCSSEDGLQSLHSDIHVLCASPGCKYSGPIHRKCLEHWDSCCDFYCQLLNNATSSIQSSQSGSLSSPTGTTLSSSSVASNFNIGCYDSAVGKSFMEGLFRLYECPLCGQYTLYRSSIDSTTAQAESSLSDHFTSVLCAIQYATEKLNQHESLIHPALHSDVLQFNSQFSLNSPVDYNSGSVEVSPNFTTGDLKFQQMSTIGQHATGRSHSYVQSPPITNQFVNILRRFSLNREKNETNCLSTGSNTSSGMSSGYYSGLSTSDNSVDPSRRNSNTSYQSLMLGRTATGQPTTFIAGTTTKEEEEEEEVVMKLHEDNSIPWMMPTSQSLPRALTKGSAPVHRQNHQVFLSHFHFFSSYNCNIENDKTETKEEVLIINILYSSHQILYTFH